MKTGNVYSWGKNHNGVLGIGHCRMQTKPLKNTTLKYIKCISVNKRNAMALNIYGNIYTWGYDTGINNGIPVLYEPLKHINITNICCGSDYYCALSKNKYNLYIWGTHCCYNDKDTEHVTLKTTRIQGMRLGLDRYVVSFGCGKEHIVIVLSNGEVYACGNNERCKYTNYTMISYTPYKLELKNIIKCASGEYHSLFLDKYGDAYECYLSHGIHKVAENIKDIRCGVSSSTIITCDGDILVWGVNNERQLFNNDNVINTPTLFV